MSDTTDSPKPKGPKGTGGIGRSTELELQILVAAEVQRQLDHERLLLRDAGGLALKIIGGSFALFIAVFAIFGLNTWSGVSQMAKDYTERRVDDLIGRSDSETGVKQTLNDLVNHAIVASELATHQSAKDNTLELPKYEWDRLKAWLSGESLSIGDFSDTLAVLNAQSADRKKLDANGILKYMLSPQGGRLHDVVKDRPDKIEAIFGSFKHQDMGAAAAEIAESSKFSEELRIDAVKYVQDLKYVGGFEKIIGVAISANPGMLKQTALVTSALLQPAHKLFINEADKLVSHPATTDSVVAAARIVQALWLTADLRKPDIDVNKDVVETSERLLRFALSNGLWFDADINQNVLLFVPQQDMPDASSELFAKFTPYWTLLSRAANASDLATLSTSLFLSFLPDMTGAAATVNLSRESALVVRDNSGQERTLQGKEISEVYMWHEQRSDPLSVRWTESGGAVSGTPLRFIGGGFTLSFHRKQAR
jgi:hypothetical protein